MALIVFALAGIFLTFGENFLYLITSGILAFVVAEKDYKKKMGILEWIKNNKEIIAWGGGAIVAIYKFAALFYKRVWKPASVFIKK
jgi:hypothetical protein